METELRINVDRCARSCVGTVVWMQGCATHCTAWEVLILARLHKAFTDSVTEDTNSLIPLCDNTSENYFVKTPVVCI